VRGVVRRGLGHAGALGAVVVLGLAAGAGPAAAQQPGGWTAPAYPGNTLTLTRDDRVVAGTVVEVGMSGHAEWRGPTDELTPPYTLSLFVQDADVDPACAPSYGQQLRKAINVSLSASDSVSGWVMQDDIVLDPVPPATEIDWSGESLPFVVRPGVERVVLCGYQRHIIDDVAGFQLPVAVDQPRCRPLRASVRRGRKLRLKCNVSGRVDVRFRGPRSRTIAARLSPKHGTGAVATRHLARGRYRVSVWVGDRRLGESFRVRIR
jgi:hypothetical protein